MRTTAVFATFLVGVLAAPATPAKRHLPNLLEEDASEIESSGVIASGTGTQAIRRADLGVNHLDEHKKRENAGLPAFDTVPIFSEGDAIDVKHDGVASLGTGNQAFGGKGLGDITINQRKKRELPAWDTVPTFSSGDKADIKSDDTIAAGTGSQSFGGSGLGDINIDQDKKRGLPAWDNVPSFSSGDKIDVNADDTIAAGTGSQSFDGSGLGDITIDQKNKRGLPAWESVPKFSSGDNIDANSDDVIAAGAGSQSFGGAGLGDITIDQKKRDTRELPAWNNVPSFSEGSTADIDTDDVVAAGTGSQSFNGKGLGDITIDQSKKRDVRALPGWGNVPSFSEGNQIDVDSDDTVAAGVGSQSFNGNGLGEVGIDQKKRDIRALPGWGNVPSFSEGDKIDVDSEDTVAAGVGSQSFGGNGLGEVGIDQKKRNVGQTAHDIVSKSKRNLEGMQTSADVNSYMPVFRRHLAVIKRSMDNNGDFERRQINQVIGGLKNTQDASELIGGVEKDINGVDNIEQWRNVAPGVNTRLEALKASLPALAVPAM